MVCCADLTEQLELGAVWSVCRLLEKHAAESGCSIGSNLPL